MEQARRGKKNKVAKNVEVSSTSLYFSVAELVKECYPVSLYVTITYKRM
jgi:hypothetical protein